MTSLDDRLVPRVQQLINKFGKQSSFQEPAKDNYDPTTGGITDTPPPAVSAKHTPPAPYKMEFIDGDVIQGGDARIFVSPQDVIPEVGWVVTVDSVVWRIISKNDIYSGEQVALIELQIRRG